MIRPKDIDEYKALMKWANVQVRGLKGSVNSSIRLYRLPPGYEGDNKVCTIEYNGQISKVTRVSIDEVIYNV